MTSKNNKAPLLYYIKHCSSFQSHRWIQTGVTVWKHSIRIKISDFLSRVTLKFDRWPQKTIGHLFYATSSFVHHFIAICEFKLELQSGNAQFGSKSKIFLAVWPWNSTGWVSEWLSLTAFLRTADIEVHIVHTSRVVIANPGCTEVRRSADKCVLPAHF